MTLADHSSTNASRNQTTTIQTSFWKTIAIWNAAWSEFRRVQRLDRTELLDLGLSEADQKSVTLREIIERMHRQA